MKAFGWAAALAALLVGWAAIHAAGQGADTTPTADTAITETFTRLAAAGDLQLGPHSRYQWHHPGPLPFYALVPAYVLSGERTAGLHAGALLINLAALAVTLWLASQYASPLVSIVVSLSVTLLLWRVPALLVSPWNPHLPVVALMALLLATAGAVSAVPIALPCVALFASLAGQSHVALTPLALVAGIVSTSGFALAAFTTRSARERLSPTTIVFTMAATDLLVLVLWSLPLFEQLTQPHGNLGLLWTHFVVESHATPAFSAALSAWADMLTGPLRPDLSLADGRPFVESPVRWAELVSGVELAGLAGSFWVASKDGRTFDARLSGVLLGASLLALWAITRSDQLLVDRVVFWITAIGALNLGVVLALGVRLIVGRRDADTLLTPWAASAGVASLAMVIWAGFTQLSGEVAHLRAPDAESSAAATVAEGVHAVILDRHIERPVVRFDQDAWGMAAGVVLELQRRDTPVAIDDDWLAMYTPALQATGHERAVIAIVGKAQHLRMPAGAGDELIAAADDRLFAHLLVP